MKKVFALLSLFLFGPVFAQSNSVELSKLGAQYSAIEALLANPGGLISGTFTSAQVIASYPPASNGGRTVLTSDMGFMACDGVRWNVVGTPPVPPGAAILSYNQNVFTYFPVLADVGSGNTPGQFKIYSGYLGLNGSEPPVNSTTFTTASNGQLQLHYNGSGNINGIFTIVPFHTAAFSQDYGQLGLALGSRGFYVEIAYTGSTNNTDVWDAFFVEPQEHNALQADKPGGSFPTCYEQWLEGDVNESGHGTDYSGLYRGTWNQWAGCYNGAYTSTATPTSTGMTLTSAWAGDTGGWTVKLSTGQTIYPATFTNGSTAVTWSSTTITGSPTTSETVSYQQLIEPQNTQTASLDYTTEHIFGGAYDPVGHTWTIWQDGVMQGQLSTLNANSSDTFRNTLHYMLIVATQSHGAQVAHTMNVRYISLWTP